MSLQNVISLDFTKNDEANSNILVPKAAFQDTSKAILGEVKQLLGSKQLDALFTVAGGWAGGNLTDDDLLVNVDAMIGQSIHTSVLAAKLASLHLKE